MQTCEDEKITAQTESELSQELTPNEQIEKRLERYHKAKIRSKAVADYILQHRADLKKYGQEVKQCGDWLIFRHFYTVGVYRMIGACSCRRHLLCMLCAIRRCAKQLQAYNEKVDFIMSQRKDLKLALISLTVRNGEDLQERFKHLDSCFGIMKKRRKNSFCGKADRGTIFSQLEGAVYTYEVTNKGNGWHPHVHILAIVPSNLDLGDVDIETGKKTRFGKFQDALICEWETITGDSKVVDAREVSETEDGQMGAFCEVFKYALKQTEMSIGSQVQAFSVLKGRRLIGSFGMLFNVCVPEGDNDSIEEELSLQPYVDLLYCHTHIFGYQLQHQFNHSLSLEESLTP